jgi:mediator of RNA polymerase II transcription subunit 7
MTSYLITDHKAAIKKLFSALMSQYLKLLNALVNNPDTAQTKVREIELIIFNIHYILNEYRPHQARQAVALVMEHQKQKRIESAGEIAKCVSFVIRGS